MVRSCGLALLFVLLVLSCARAQAPVPPEADVKAATKLVSDVYKKDYEAAKSPSQKQTLALKLLEDADKTLDDKTSAYAMYQVAQKIAVGLGDVETALRVGERIAARYDVDAAAQRRQLLESLAESVRTPLEASSLTRYLGNLLPLLVKQNKFQEVGPLLELTTDVAKKSKDADLQKYWAWKGQRLKAQATAWSVAKAALDKLEASPTDAEASGTAGEYRAFWEEDWKAAIPLLALSTQQPWQALAERELQGASTEADKLALADAWYDAANKATSSPVKEAALRHAGQQYDRLVSSLSALPKRRVEGRLSEIRDVASPLPKDVWVEVLDLVDTSKHLIEGDWKREGLNIVYRDPNHCKQFFVPVLAEGAYELRVRATRMSGDDGLSVSLSRSVNSCGFGLNVYHGKHSGLQLLDKQGTPDNSARVAPAPMMDGQPFQLLLQVEPKDDKATIAALYNNRPYVRWTGERSRLSCDQDSHRERIVLHTCHTTFAVHSVQFKRKSGAAWLIE
jgi:hypothetical protein